MVANQVGINIFYIAVCVNAADCHSSSIKSLKRSCLKHLRNHRTFSLYLKWLNISVSLWIKCILKGCLYNSPKWLVLKTTCSTFKEFKGLTWLTRALCWCIPFTTWLAWLARSNKILESALISPQNREKLPDNIFYESRF